MDVQVRNSKERTETFSLQSLLREARPAGRGDAGPAMPLDKGGILIRTDVALPFPLEFRPAAGGWQFVRNTTARQLEGTLEEQGWYLFCLTPEVTATGFALSFEGAVRKALRKVLASALANGVNAVELAPVAGRRVFGIWRAKLAAKMRHIQHGPYLFSTVEEMHKRLSQVVHEVDPRAQALLRRAGFRNV